MQPSPEQDLEDVFRALLADSPINPGWPFVFRLRLC
jgi:hypothetical protein